MQTRDEVSGLIQQQSAALAFNAAAQQHLPLLIGPALLDDVWVSEASQLHVVRGMRNDGLLLLVPPDQILVTCANSTGVCTTMISRACLLVITT